ELEAQGVTTFVELGPAGVLSGLVPQAVARPDAVVAVPTGRTGRPEAEVLTGALGTLYTRGVAVDWRAFFDGSGARAVDLPTYAFQHRRYWLLPDPDDAAAAAPRRGPAGVRAEERGSEEEAGAPTLAERLAVLSEPERERYLLDTVTAMVASVLGHDPVGITSDRPFQELGFDSLTGVELRNRLSAATGADLPPTLVFDYPNPAALAAYLLVETAPRPVDPVRAVHDVLDRFEGTLAELPPDEEARSGISVRLRALLAELSGPQSAPATVESLPTPLTAASTDEIFDFIDTQLGRAAG
ncbi:phosphopantetheine-binding protein, partial [Streptomyces sp. GMR22]|uniref:phosphopantetheine-binding protein n=2 Tax=Streptomyces TaxID=1883 RepID=UPI0017D829DB